MSWFDEAKAEHGDKWREIVKKAIYEAMNDKREEPKMQVSYKGVTGELLKLERYDVVEVSHYLVPGKVSKYKLDIADAEDGHKHSFENVDISEVKFIGATVTMG